MTFVFRDYAYSRLVIGFFWPSRSSRSASRGPCFRELFRFTRRHGFNQRYAIVVGGGEPAAEVLRVLRRRPDVGIGVLGMLSDKREVPDNVRWLGGIEDVRAVLDRHQVDIVFIALPHADYSRLTAVLHGIGDDPVAIHLVPMSSASRPCAAAWRSSRPYRSSICGSRRSMDGTGCSSARSTRRGRAGADPRRAGDARDRRGAQAHVAGPCALPSGAHGRRRPPLPHAEVPDDAGDAEAQTGPVWATADDPRRTGLGAFLRRWSLDELPQLLNVLRGEMSLVGPRPERPSFVEEFRRRVPGYMLRHKVKAGITGWAQINGWRGNTSIERRIECDLYYIERWSLAFDLRILIQTLWYGIRNRNAY